ncbi:hypothetical protein Ancab_013577 [Ancistrocladus abbreviatus]
MKELHWRNSPLIMSQCGSKGSPINISQMVACVGQQTVGGHRAPDGFIDQSLPHFPRKSKTPANVKVLDDMKLAVIPEAEKADLHFALHWVKNRLPLVVIKGIQTVERAIIAEEEGKKGKLQLIVEGMGLKEVMGVDGVDGCKTESNHVMEVQATLGIEAARNCIIKEIRKVMQSHSMEIDIRHMMLLADLMTFKREVLAMTRDGTQKMKDSVLMLASFERTADHLFNASASGKEDMIDGVSECIIVGVPMRVGTGMLEVKQRFQLSKMASKASIVEGLASFHLHL